MSLTDYISRSAGLLDLDGRRVAEARHDEGQRRPVDEPAVADLVLLAVQRGLIHAIGSGNKPPVSLVNR